MRQFVLLLPILLPSAQAQSLYDLNEVAGDPDLALSLYFRERISDEHVFSTGGMSADGIVGAVSFATGVRPHEDGREYFGRCGTLIRDSSIEAPADPLRAGCEKMLLRAIKRLSQPVEPGPYPAGGASDVSWEDKLVTLVTSDVALVVEGSYVDPGRYRSCMNVSDCCPTNGALYLDSCREPTDGEWYAIDHCQAQGLGCRSPEYLACLREQGVRTGCDEQPDGSRICY